jgi:hypothetical protein
MVRMGMSYRIDVIESRRLFTRRKGRAWGQEEQIVGLGWGRHRLDIMTLTHFQRMKSNGR